MDVYSCSEIYIQLIYYSNQFASQRKILQKSIKMRTDGIKQQAEIISDLKNWHFLSYYLFENTQDLQIDFKLIIFEYPSRYHVLNRIMKNND